MESKTSRKVLHIFRGSFEDAVMISDEGKVTFRDSESTGDASDAEKRSRTNSLSEEYQEKAGESLSSSAFLEEHLQVARTEAGSDDEDDALLDILSESHVCADIGFAPYCLLHVHSYRMWPIESSLAHSLASTADTSVVSSEEDEEEEEEDDDDVKRECTSDGEGNALSAFPGDSFLSGTDRSQERPSSPEVPRRGSAGAVKYTEAMGEWKSNLMPSWDSLTMLDLTAISHDSKRGGEGPESATAEAPDDGQECSALTSRGATPGRQLTSIQMARRLRSTSSPSVMLVRAPSPVMLSGRSKDSSSSTLLSPGDPMSSGGDASTAFDDCDTGHTGQEASTACPLLFVTGAATQRLITISAHPSESLTAALLGEPALIDFELLSSSMVFPELELLPPDVTIATADVRYLSSSRVAVFGTTSGVVYVTRMAMELEASSSRLLHHQPSLLTVHLDGPISAVRWLPRDTSDDHTSGERFLQRLRERKSRETWERPSSDDGRERNATEDEPLQLLVCGMVGYALLYTDVNANGLRGARLLPESDLYDTVTCCHCGHVMLDGRDGPDDVLLGTYGGDVLLYSSFPVERNSEDVDAWERAQDGDGVMDAEWETEMVRGREKEGEKDTVRGREGEGKKLEMGLRSKGEETPHSCREGERSELEQRESEEDVDKDIWISAKRHNSDSGERAERLQSFPGPTTAEEDARGESDGEERGGGGERREEEGGEEEEEEEYQLVWSRNFLQPVMSLAVGDFTSTGVDYIAVVTFSGLHLLRPSEEDLKSALSQSLALSARKRDLDLAIRQELTALEHLRQALAEAEQ